MILNPTGVSQTSMMDIYADAYYQQGFQQVSMKIEQNNIY
jgi:hypothetical protein